MSRDNLISFDYSIIDLLSGVVGKVAEIKTNEVRKSTKLKVWMEKSSVQPNDFFLLLFSMGIY